jgi:hypothetical protein
MENNQSDMKGYIIKHSDCDQEFPMTVQCFNSIIEFVCPHCKAIVDLTKIDPGKPKSEKEFDNWRYRKGYMTGKELREKGLIGGCWGEENVKEVLANMKAKRKL